MANFWVIYTDHQLQRALISGSFFGTTNYRPLRMHHKANSVQRLKLTHQMAVAKYKVNHSTCVLLASKLPVVPFTNDNLATMVNRQLCESTGPEVKLSQKFSDTLEV